MSPLRGSERERRGPRTWGLRHQAIRCRRFAARNEKRATADLGLTPPGYTMSPLRGSERTDADRRPGAYATRLYDVAAWTWGLRRQAIRCRRFAARNADARTTDLGLTPPGYTMSPLRGSERDAADARTWGLRRQAIRCRRFAARYDRVVARARSYSQVDRRAYIVSGDRCSAGAVTLSPLTRPSRFFCSQFKIATQSNVLTPSRHKSAGVIPPAPVERHKLFRWSFLVPQTSEGQSA